MQRAAKTSSTRILAVAAITCLVFAGALFQMTGRVVPGEPTRIDMMKPIGSR